MSDNTEREPDVEPLPEWYGVSRRPVPPEQTAQANRTWWDDNAEEYYVDHGAFLGDDRLVWGPEGHDEEQVRHLGDPGDLVGRRVLEIGAGAAQGSRWVRAQGGQVVATDLSGGMLRRGRALDARAAAGEPVPLLQCDARRLPLADASVDLVFSAYGVLPFVADPQVVLDECARVLRPGGRVVLAMTHPIRWTMPDDPGPRGLQVTQSYFDTTPYVEEDEHGRVVYTEHHATVGMRVRQVLRAGLDLTDLIEPPWPEHNTETWGGWSPLRGRLIPGTLILIARRPTRG